MPAQLLEYSCPTCKKESGQVNQMMASDRQLVCRANPTHAWSDTQTFLNLHPTMDFNTVKVATPQFNQAEVKLFIPPRVKDQLTNKWGERFQPTVAGFLEMISGGEFLVLSQGDLEKLKLGEFLGEKPSNAPQLCGLIYAMRSQVRDATQEVENARADVKAYETHSPGRVVIDVASFQQIAMEKAKEEGLPLKLWIEAKLKFALENGWF